MIWFEHEPTQSPGPVVTSGEPIDEDDDGPQLQAEREVVCAACGASITAIKHAASRGGAHRHTQMNPHGYFFTVRCFESAQNVCLLGAPCTEWSWFDGFAWQIADCARCGTHLGWRFVAALAEGAERSGPFYGFIEDRLRERC